MHGRKAPWGLQVDTIVACASGAAVAGVAVLRLSGPLAINIGARIAGLRPAQLGHARMRLRRLRDGEGATLDRGYVVAFVGPRSFTGEDVCELHVHGSPAVCERIIDHACGLGARPAQPGEFTRRAFFAGKLDLAQAEALQDLVSARSEAARALALEHLDGRTGALLRALREPVVAALAHAEARLDFAEHEDVGGLPEQLVVDIADVAARMRTLAATARAGRARIEGVRVALYGAPNAGKSTLFNGLIGDDRALVHHEPGTTRDVVQVHTTIDGLPLCWLDTAGIREGSGDVEFAGIQRANAAVATADIVLWLTDRSVATNGVRHGDVPPPPDGPADRVVLRYLSKADLRPDPSHTTAPHRPICAHRPADLLAITGDIVRAARTLTHPPVADGAVLARTRHAVALLCAATAIERAHVGLRQGLDLELIAADLRDAADALAEVTGEIAPDDVLDAVFSSFCIGK